MRALVHGCSSVPYRGLRFGIRGWRALDAFVRVEGGRERHGLQADISDWDGTFWDTPTGYASSIPIGDTAGTTYGSGSSVFTQTSTADTA